MLKVNGSDPHARSQVGARCPNFEISRPKHDACRAGPASAEPQSVHSCESPKLSRTKTYRVPSLICSETYAMQPSTNERDCPRQLLTMEVPCLAAHAYPARCPLQSLEHLDPLNVPGGSFGGA